VVQIVAAVDHLRIDQGRTPHSSSDLAAGRED
jgi:hypothetical protein